MLLVSCVNDRATDARTIGVYKRDGRDTVCNKANLVWFALRVTQITACLDI